MRHSQRGNGESFGYYIANDTSITHAICCILKHISTRSEWEKREANICETAHGVHENDRNARTKAKITCISFEENIVIQKSHRTVPSASSIGCFVRSCASPSKMILKCILQFVSKRLFCYAKDNDIIIRWEAEKRAWATYKWLNETKMENECNRLLFSCTQTLTHERSLSLSLSLSAALTCPVHTLAYPTQRMAQHGDERSTVTHISCWCTSTFISLFHIFLYIYFLFASFYFILFYCYKMLWKRRARRLTRTAQIIIIKLISQLWIVSCEIVLLCMCEVYTHCTKRQRRADAWEITLAGVFRLEIAVQLPLE